MKMKTKKGLGLLEIVSLMLYGLTVVFFIILFIIPSCLSPFNTMKMKIAEDADMANVAKLNTWFNTALRAPLPENLPEEISDFWSEEREFNDGVEFDWEAARDSLNNNPEIYKGRTFGEFIAMLTEFNEDEREDILVTVTYLMFNEKQDDSTYDILPLRVWYWDGTEWPRDEDILTSEDAHKLEGDSVYLPTPQGDLVKVMVVIP